MSDQFKEAFREEAREHLATLEDSLLQLEEQPDDRELIGAVFRSLHTIKGSGSMFGFDEIAIFTHEVETVFDLVRNGEMSVSKELIDLTLRARDCIRTMLDETAAVSDLSPEIICIVSGLKELLPVAGSGTNKPAMPKVEASTVVAEAALAVTYRVQFHPSADVMANGTNPISLLEELSRLGEYSVTANTGDISPLDELDPERCYVHWDIIITTTLGVDAIRDVFIFVEDSCGINIVVIDDGSALEDEPTRKLGEILVERGEVSAEAVQNALTRQKRLGEVLIDEGKVSPAQVNAALKEQKHLQEVHRERQSSGQGDTGSSTIRVPADKLDMLVNLVGEQVTIQERLMQAAISRGDTELIAIAEDVERLTASLRDTTLNIRMLPIGTTFTRFRRLVRDLSSELGKKVELTTDGGETELDKTVIEKLNDPLVHIIRNSIDHGVESPEVRASAGKPEVGTVHLSAMHTGDSVMINVRDDGAGLNREAIRSKAVARGIIREEDSLSDKELFGLIFAAGFSTAKAVTSVSGRGVGMDVVKQAIEALRGSIEVTSEEGVCTQISLRIPLTLAIVETLLVQIEESRFVMPLAQIEECIDLTREDLAKAHGRNIVRTRGHAVPYIPLRESFGIAGIPPEIEQVVIVNLCGERIGFLVDRVIGQHQTVIKSLGSYYHQAEGVSGATILGDGSVALILDLPRLVGGVGVA